MLYFWWGYRGNLKLITLGSEGVNPSCRMMPLIGLVAERTGVVALNPWWIQFPRTTLVKRLFHPGKQLHQRVFPSEPVYFLQGFHWSDILHELLAREICRPLPMLWLGANGIRQWWRQSDATWCIWLTSSLTFYWASRRAHKQILLSCWLLRVATVKSLLHPEPYSKQELCKFFGLDVRNLSVVFVGLIRPGRRLGTKALLRQLHCSFSLVWSVIYIYLPSRFGSANVVSWCSIELIEECAKSFLLDAWAR